MRWASGSKPLARLLAFGLCGALVSACGGDDSGSNGGAGASAGSSGAGGSDADGGTSTGGTSGNTSTGGTGARTSTAGTGGGGTSGPISLGDLPEALSTAYCDAIAPCCGDLGIPLDAGSCRQYLGAQMQESLDAARPENYEYDANAAGTCLDRFRALGDSCTSLTMASTRTFVCNEVFVGRLEPGAPCLSDIECAGAPEDDPDCQEENACTVGPDGGLDCTTVTSMCMIEHRGVAGDACYWTCTQEGVLTSCSGQGGDEMPGDSRCFVNDGLYCSEARVCAAQLPLNSMCDTDDACSGDAQCDSASQVCVPRSVEGEMCNFDSDCSGGLYCKNDVCVPNLAPGSPCDEFVDTCLNGSCDAGTCVENGDLGSAALALACAFIAGGGFPQP